MDAIDRINMRLKTILKYVGYLKKYQGITVEELEQNHEKRGAIERFFQLATGAVIDVANLLNSEYRFRPAQDARESTFLLSTFYIKILLSRSAKNDFFVATRI